MKLELSPRETLVARLLGAAWLLAVLAVAVGVTRSRNELLARGESLEAALESARAERDGMAARLAPFEVLAAKQFPKAAPEKRLAQLLERIDAMTVTAAGSRARRHLEPEAVARIQAKFNTTPGIQIEVGGIAGDAESTALAAEIKTLLDDSGLKTRTLAEYVPSPSLPAGVAVFSKHEYDEVLSGAIAQLFAELGQKPVQWIEEDLAQGSKPEEPAPDVKFIVGKR